MVESEDTARRPQGPERRGRGQANFVSIQEDARCSSTEGEARDHEGHRIEPLRLQERERSARSAETEDDGADHLPGNCAARFLRVRGVALLPPFTLIPLHAPKPLARVGRSCEVINPRAEVSSGPCSTLLRNEGASAC